MEWPDVSVDSDRGWRVTYNELHHFPDELWTHTSDNTATFNPVKPHNTYAVEVYSSTWDHHMTMIFREYYHIDGGNSLTVTWIGQSEFGFYVEASRVSRGKEGSFLLAKTATGVDISGLEMCTDYIVYLHRVLGGLQVEQVTGVTTKTGQLSVLPCQTNICH